MGCSSSKDVTLKKSTLSEPGRISIPPLPEFLTEPGCALIQNAQPVLNRIVSKGPKLLNATVATTQTVVSTRAVHHLKNIFVAPLEDIQAFRAPDFPKSPDEKTFLRQALQQNFLFAALSEREIRTIVDAFELISKSSHDVIIQQGDAGDYFYVIRKGTVQYLVDGVEVGQASEGKSFGELSLLYTSPRAATVLAETDVELYRVDQTTFRYILQSQTQQAESAKKDLLLGVPFLKGLDLMDLNKLVYSVTTQTFEPGDYILRKGEDGETFYIIQQGQVKVTDITIGSTDYEDQTLGPGDYFGERALLTKDPRAANCIAKTKVVTLSIDKETFEIVVGKLHYLTTKAEDIRKLSAIRVFQLSNLPLPTLYSIANQLEDQAFPGHTNICVEGTRTQAALYFVRYGNVEMKSSTGQYNIIDEGGYFGEDTLEIDVGGVKKETECIAKYSVRTLGGDVILGVLTLQKCRNVFDTTTLGLGNRQIPGRIEAQVDIPLDALEKHAILGAGTFGQVWLVSHKAPNGVRQPYALKIQSKYELISNQQAKGVVREKNIMKELHHPFLINLVQTYQDPQRVYMLLGLVQGGELFSRLHQATHDGIPENDAKFYAAGIIEGLSYMHSRHILYRDLKPENVLIDSDGYPVIVDFGFAKHVPNKTYTLCGTPLYLAPEVILNRGHNRGADHWSYAVMLYEMIAGYTPFYKEGMDQLALFRKICSGEYSFPESGVMSMEVEDLLQRFFVVEPTRRLGSLARAINEIYAHLWFSQIDFAELRQKAIDAPWVPDIKDPLDKTNFENWDHLDDRTLKTYPGLLPFEAEVFRSF